MKAALGPVAIGMAAIGGIKVLGGFIADARESAKIGAITAQVIKTTGGAAKLTADQVGDLATSISNKTGVDDEAIQSGANLLLTFTNLKNGAGKGNDIFSQTTSIMTDMAVAMGQDPKSAAIGLGKALNDPVKGVTALSKVGVSFTAEQKKQIETLVKSGDTMGAQKVILHELGKEFGGAAAAAGTPMDRLKTTVGNLGEAIGAKLIPFADKAATLLTKFVGGITDAFSSGGIGGVVTYVQDVITGALPGIKAKLGEWASAFGDWIVAATPPLLAKLGALLQALGTWINGTGLPWLGAHLLVWGTALVDWIQPMIGPALDAVGDFLLKILTWIGTVGLPKLGNQLLAWGQAFVKWISPMIPPALAAVGDFLLQILGWLVGTGIPWAAAALAKLAVAFVQWIEPLIPPALAALGRFALSIADWLVTTALPWAAAALGKLALAFLEWVGPMIPPLLLELAKLGLKLVNWIVTTAVPWAIVALGKLELAFIAWVVPMIPKVLAELVKLGLKLVDWLLTTAVPWVITALLKLAAAFIEWVAPMIPKALAELGKLLGALLLWIVTDGIPQLGEKMLGLGTSVIKSLGSGLKDGFVAVVTWLGQLPQKILDAVGNLGSVLYDAGKAIIQGLIDGIAKMFGKLKDKLTSVTNLIPSWKGPARTDAKLLTPAGRLIMESLITGFDDRTPAVKASLAALTADLGRTATDPSIGLRGVGAASTAAPAASGGTLNVHNYDRPFDAQAAMAALSQYEALHGYPVLAGSGFGG